MHRLRIKGRLQLLSWFLTSYLLFHRIYTVAEITPNFSTNPTNPKLDPTCRLTLVKLWVTGFMWLRDMSALSDKCQFMPDPRIRSFHHSRINEQTKEECWAQHRWRWPDQAWPQISFLYGEGDGYIQPYIWIHPSIHLCWINPVDISKSLVAFY